MGTRINGYVFGGPYFPSYVRYVSADVHVDKYVEMCDPFQVWLHVGHSRDDMHVRTYVSAPMWTLT